MSGTHATSQTALLHVKRLNKTEFPILVYLCVFYFQMQPFRFLLKERIYSRGLGANYFIQEVSHQGIEFCSD